MPRKQKVRNQGQVGDYRHDDAKRKNNPPAGIAPTYEVQERQARTYAYDPHLDPQLQWAGKAEHTSFDVDVVSLHIHERISTRAILEAVKKPEPQLSLFGETPLPLHQQIEFYQHEVGWVNRLILGDSLLAMNSLLVKEGMAGKVQVIYVDPPYGIKYASNFQPRTDRRDVKDKDEDLTHEPEQIKAYRDTWKLGIHSYLTYLRDRLLLARELLTESGSIFVQINDENLHLVRSLLDEVFGRENFVLTIVFKKKGATTTQDPVNDYLLWFAKDKSQIRPRRLFIKRSDPEDDPKFNTLIAPPREYIRVIDLDPSEIRHLLNEGYEWARVNYPVVSQEPSPTRSKEFVWNGKGYSCGENRHWTYDPDTDMRRLAEADHLFDGGGKSLGGVVKWNDWPYVALSNLWDDLHGEQEIVFAVQTNRRVIERCILMTTDPGDLVFDPTCGSGTTAYCAEKWGRRWITCDTSRVALAIARQRLMTARFDYYELADSERGPAGGFIYETVPHITLESIAKNTEIDAIAARYQPQIDAALAELNQVLGKAWKEWEVPREAEPKWSKVAQDAILRYWSLKRRKRQEIDESIQRNAPQETLYDRPKEKRGVVRVSGPFTVEAIPVPAVEDPMQAPIPQFEDVAQDVILRHSDRGGDYLTTMLNLLKQQGGVLFPGGKKMELQNLRPLSVGMLHAEAETTYITAENAESAKKKSEPASASSAPSAVKQAVRVALSFGPQHGPVTAFQAQEAIPTAKMNGYQVLIFAGFSFDPEAQALIQKAPVAGLQIHFANIAPDVLVGDLLKTTRASQIFTVFGQPDVQVAQVDNLCYTVELRGVDIYDPLTGETQHARGADVAAWFLDTDYDGMTFHICQAFFPGDADAWDKLQRALKAQIDLETFEQMRGTVSFPFQSGEHQRIAVKVIDFRGNEVVRVMPLGEVTYSR